MSNGDPKDEAKQNPEQQSSENNKLKLSLHADMPLGHVSSVQGQTLKENQVRIRQSLEAVHRELAELNRKVGNREMPASKVFNEAMSIFQKEKIEIPHLEDATKPGIDQVNNSANNILGRYFVQNRALLTEAQAQAGLTQLQAAVGKKLQKMEEPSNKTETQGGQEQTSSNSTPRNR